MTALAGMHGNHLSRHTVELMAQSLVHRGGYEVKK